MKLLESAGDMASSYPKPGCVYEMANGCLPVVGTLVAVNRTITKHAQILGNYPNRIVATCDCHATYTSDLVACFQQPCLTQCRPPTAPLPLPRPPRARALRATVFRSSSSCSAALPPLPLPLTRRAMTGGASCCAGGAGSRTGSAATACPLPRPPRPAAAPRLWYWGALQVAHPRRDPRHLPHPN